MSIFTKIADKVRDLREPSYAPTSIFDNPVRPRASHNPVEAKQRRRLARRLWKENLHVDVIAEQVGVSPNTVYAYVSDLKFKRKGQRNGKVSR